MIFMQRQVSFFKKNFTCSKDFFIGKNSNVVKTSLEFFYLFEHIFFFFGFLKEKNQTFFERNFEAVKTFFQRSKKTLSKKTFFLLAFFGF